MDAIKSRITYEKHSITRRDANLTERAMNKTAQQMRLHSIFTRMASCRTEHPG